MEELLAKYEELKAYLLSLESIAVAFSSGVDSAFLLYACKDAFSENKNSVIAVTSAINSFPERDLNESQEFCSKYGVKQKIITIDELLIEGFTSNPPDRCYICKKALFSTMKDWALSNGFKAVVEGSNLDDDSDYRPGHRAIKELEIISPLRKIGFTKNDIRMLSKHFDIPTWNKPSFACLSSRIPYGEVITREKLKMVEEGEQFLMDLGFSQFRVRAYEKDGLQAKIEVLLSEIDRFKDEALYSKVETKLKTLGFNEVIVDPKGFRSGSLNEALK